MLILPAKLASFTVEKVTNEGFLDYISNSEDKKKYVSWRQLYIYLKHTADKYMMRKE